VTVRIIDADPELLRRRAEAALHAHHQGDVHIAAEATGDVPTIVATLTDHGPWAWAVMPEVRDDGTVVLPIQTTRDGIEEMYKALRGYSDVLGAEVLVDVRGEWYVFEEALASMRERATGEYSEWEMITILPVTTGKGITGELCWWRIGGAPDNALQLRRDALARHDRYLAALRAGDVDGVVAEFAEQAQCAVRDYVADTGTITGLHGAAGLREHLQALVDRYEILGVDMLHRVVADWYLFAEVRISVRERAGGAELAWHAAEFFAPGPDGRWIARIGHGTDPAVQALV
jgi:hypothetical protein